MPSQVTIICNPLARTWVEKRTFLDTKLPGPPVDIVAPTTGKRVPDSVLAVSCLCNARHVVVELRRAYARAPWVRDHKLNDLPVDPSPSLPANVRENIIAERDEGELLVRKDVVSVRKLVALGRHRSYGCKVANNVRVRRRSRPTRRSDSGL
ncbi:hypothetical protein HGRIS_013380 [Hohenbuehelia grisea]|uniref:Ig-like domain-containing protein n=1 Tax=Hohenbuehelia grisea TaxID=104357 RepID=A0ABR3IVK8_9AGAR